MLVLRLRIGIWGVVLLCLGLAGGVIAMPKQAQNPILKNGGFEVSGAGGLLGWGAFELGFTTDRQTVRNGDQAIRCESLRSDRRYGAVARIELNQKRPLPILISGWSKADSVSGNRDMDYAIYVDLEYVDGTPLYGRGVPFSVGTHDWERRQVLIHPQKPVKSVSLYALFRLHSGTAWFDDFDLRELSGNRIFDSQPMEFAPRSRMGTKSLVKTAGQDGLGLLWSAQGDIIGVESGGEAISSQNLGGFFVRDVGAEGTPVAFKGAVTARKGGGADLTGGFPDQRLSLNARVTPEGEGLLLDAQIIDLSKTERAVTLYFMIPIDALGWKWAHDIRNTEAIDADREFSNQVTTTAGATGGLSLYPFGGVFQEKQGVVISNQMDWPSVYRIFYSSSHRQLVIAWDFALTPKSAAWPPHQARGRCHLFRIAAPQAVWGFRAAAQRFYKTHAAMFARRAKHEGIWIPFADPSKVERPEDFGFAYHEGDNSVRTDDAKNILSFRYTEPSTYWMPMPPEMPRTYANAIALLEKNAKEGKGEARDMARAVLTSGAHLPDGKFALEFQNAPWANGAVFILNPNPELAATEENPTRAFVAYSLSQVKKRYDPALRATQGDLDGEYLDSLEGWTDVLDYRATHLQASPYPPTYDFEARKPAVPQWFSLHAFARFLRDDLHNRGKLLMANTTPIRFSVLASLMDVMGIETNWLLSNGIWAPDSDATFNLRRTMSAQKPYLLLMNTDFDRFTPLYVEKYFQTCLFYGVYPSMFSVDAANSPYWEAPKWYNRDRELFKRYIPLVKRVSAAGWEPITYARCDNPQASLERFGARLFTVRNFSSQKQTATLDFDLAALKLPSKPYRLKNWVKGEMMGEARGAGRYFVSLEPEETLLLELLD